VPREDGAAVHRQVVVRIEGDPTGAGQAEAAFGSQRVDASDGVLGVDGLGILALEAEKDGPVRAVAVAGGAQRAVELDLDPGRPLEQTVALPASARPCATTTARSRRRRDRVR
jgi:hypothetical protein